MDIRRTSLPSGSRGWSARTCTCRPVADWCHVPDAAWPGPGHRGSDRNAARRLHERPRPREDRSGSGPLRLFAKTALVIRPGTTFELTVPAPFTTRLSIGWGAPGTPSHRVLVGNCPSTGGGWPTYAGGLWTDHPACVPVIVKAGGKQQQVHIGVGTTCPGQRPPQGPSQG
jgi:hypothetical protein